MDCMKGVIHNLFYRSGNSGLVRPFWIFVLISLYVVFFGINTFERFTKESIIVIKENLMFRQLILTQVRRDFCLAC